MVLELNLLPPEKERLYDQLPKVVNRFAGKMGAPRRQLACLTKKPSKKSTMLKPEIEEFPSFEVTNVAPVSSLSRQKSKDAANSVKELSEAELAKLQEPYVPRSGPPQMILNHTDLSEMLIEITAGLSRI